MVADPQGRARMMTVADRPSVVRAGRIGAAVERKGEKRRIERRRRKKRIATIWNDCADAR
jgi:hypothetical protein